MGRINNKFSAVPAVCMSEITSRYQFSPCIDVDYEHLTARKQQSASIY